ncbi:MAG: DegV family protein [Clostridiales bacterium]|nr:DegV family protein [Clostridiales bacterium]
MQHNYAILGDVTCDLSNELRERFGIDGYIQGYITKPDGSEVPSKLEWDFTDAQSFYTALKARNNGYSTAPGSAEEIATLWEAFLAQGKDVLSVSISGAMSVTYNLMVNAQRVLREKYPARKIIVIDSRKYSAATGLLILQAAELRNRGLSIEENAARLEEMKHSLHQMGAMDDLFFIASKGRISHAKAFMGQLVGIKPMGDFDADGMVTVLAKAKGYEKAYRAIVEYIQNIIVAPEGQTILVAHTMREKQAETLANLIREQVCPKEVIICEVFSASGVNIGPGMIAAFYFGTPISDLAHERAVMDAVMENQK